MKFMLSHYLIPVNIERLRRSYLHCTSIKRKTQPRKKIKSRYGISRHAASVKKRTKDVIFILIFYKL